MRSAPRLSRMLQLWLCTGLAALVMALAVPLPADGDNATTPAAVSVAADVESADFEADLPALRTGYSMPRTGPVGARYERTFLVRRVCQIPTPPERPPRLA